MEQSVHTEQLRITEHENLQADCKYSGSCKLKDNKSHQVQIQLKILGTDLK